MTDRRRTQAELNQRIAGHLPANAWDSTVSIVVAHQGAVYHVGTGVLFQVADTCFVVTAAHVLVEPHRYEKTVGISGADGHFIAAGGDWIASVPKEAGSSDPLDVAVYRLPETAKTRLAGKRFLRAADVDFAAPPRMAVYAVFGFPGEWTLPSKGPNEEVRLRPLEYIGYACDRGLDGLVGYDAAYHLLIDARSIYLSTGDGYETSFTDRCGETLPLNAALKGISGSTVWLLGDLGVPLEHWERRAPKVVAVETAVYNESEVIRATRWTAVATLINEAFPELRPSIALWSE